MEKDILPKKRVVRKSARATPVPDAKSPAKDAEVPAERPTTVMVDMKPVPGTLETVVVRKDVFDFVSRKTIRTIFWFATIAVQLILMGLTWQPMSSGWGGMERCPAYYTDRNGLVLAGLILNAVAYMLCSMENALRLVNMNEHEKQEQTPAIVLTPSAVSHFLVSAVGAVYVQGVSHGVFDVACLETTRTAAAFFFIVANAVTLNLFVARAGIRIYRSNRDYFSLTKKVTVLRPAEKK